MMMHKNQSVSSHKFSMIPKAEIPRSSFRMQKTHKTTFDAGLLVPIFVEEVLPGDTFNVNLTAFCRMATPIFPVMDNLHLETFFFFVPNRLVWSNWVRFMGEQDNPSSSISFTIPQIVYTAGSHTVGSIFDMMGVPVVGQVPGGNSYSYNSLPLRCYNLIYNDWFRDENLQDSLSFPVGDGPDAVGQYVLRRRGKRHDYFTSCLPWTQKGGIAIQLPLGSTAPVISAATGIPSFTIGADANVRNLSASGTEFARFLSNSATGDAKWSNPNLVADLSAATAATINQIRQAFQIQRLLERDARGGTRYTELVRSHFGVVSPDARLQRPEYLGGGRTPVNINPIAQTSGTGASGQSTPLGNLAAMGTALARGHAFTYSAVEHGYILGLANVHADLTYQQGLRRMWSRLTRYDFYFPVFAHLGEQAVLNKEIYCDGSANDSLVFGYQERWAEYRYNPSQICGLFRSTAAGTIDAWHFAQRFTSLPTLNTTFIQDTPPLSRALAVGTAANGQQFLFDGFYDMRVARPMPMYSVPGLVDHF